MLSELLWIGPCISWRETEKGERCGLCLQIWNGDWVSESTLAGNGRGSHEQGKTAAYVPYLVIPQTWIAFRNSSTQNLGVFSFL